MYVFCGHICTLCSVFIRLRVCLFVNLCHVHVEERHSQNVCGDILTLPIHFARASVKGPSVSSSRHAHHANTGAIEVLGIYSIHKCCPFPSLTHQYAHPTGKVFRCWELPGRPRAPFVGKLTASAREEWLFLFTSPRFLHLPQEVARSHPISFPGYCLLKIFPCVSWTSVLSVPCFCLHTPLLPSLRCPHVLSLSNPPPFLDGGGC